MEGLVTKSTGSWYRVLMPNGIELQCRIRGKIRLKGLRTTNPVAVGDLVLVHPENETEGVITDIQPRKNYIIRRSTNLSKEAQVIAANVDMAYLFVTLALPETLQGFIDRFLVSAEAYRIPAALIFNKIDIYEPEAFEIIEYYEQLYQSLGYKTFRLSAINQEGLDEIKAELKDKISVFSGHSGTGKSTISNLLIPGLNARTGKLSTSHLTGKHTTTFAEMHTLPFGGYLVDTPGVRAFGVVDFEREHIAHYFPEFRALMDDCKFNNCLHLNEPGCAVKAALEEGYIDPSRYNTYLSLMNPEEGSPYRKDIYG
ncbi:MAG: ribosome small subunit-dependent GTPase A [Luteibaculaceae bacterium]